MTDATRIDLTNTTYLLVSDYGKLGLEGYTKGTETRESIASDIADGNAEHATQVIEFANGVVRDVSKEIAALVWAMDDIADTASDFLASHGFDLDARNDEQEREERANRADDEAVYRSMIGYGG